LKCYESHDASPDNVVRNEWKLIGLRPLTEKLLNLSLSARRLLCRTLLCRRQEAPRKENV
jgi:hypothetical protein